MQTEVNNLNVKYINSNKKSSDKYAHILKDITLDVKHNSLNAIIGASGGGKTTFVNTLKGYVPQGSKTSGSIKISGKDRTYEDWHHNSILMDQEEIMNEHFTIYTECLRVLQLETNLDKKEMDAKIDNILERLGISSKKNQKIKTLSGGQKKRTHIALALLSDRKYIFLDEPNSGLDDMTAFNIIKYLKELCEKKGKTILITIHQPSEEVFEYIDNLIFISSGKIFYSGLIENCVPYMESYGIKNTKKRTPIFFLIETTASEDPEIKNKLDKMCLDYKIKHVDNYKETNEVTENYTVNDSKIKYSAVKTLFWDYFTREIKKMNLYGEIINIVLFLTAAIVFCFFILKKDCDLIHGICFVLFTLVSCFSIPSKVYDFSTRFNKNKKYYLQEIEKNHYNWPTLLTAWVCSMLSYFGIIYAILATIYISIKLKGNIVNFFVPLNFIISVPFMIPHFMVIVFTVEHTLLRTFLNVILTYKFFGLQILPFVVSNILKRVSNIIGEKTLTEENTDKICKVFYFIEVFFSPIDIVSLLEKKFIMRSYGLKDLIETKCKMLLKSNEYDKDETKYSVENYFDQNNNGKTAAYIDNLKNFADYVLKSSYPTTIFSFINCTPMLIIRLLIGMSIPLYIVYRHFKSTYSRNFRFTTGKK